MLRIQLSNPRNNNSQTPRSEADRYAIRYGLSTAVIIVVVHLLLYAAGNRSYALTYVGIFLLLFAMVGYGTHQSRQWIRAEHAMNDRMLFGLVLSIVTALGVIAMNGILSLVNYHLIVKETILSIDDGLRFAINSLGLFWSCLIFGFSSSMIFSFWYEKN